MSRRAFLAVRLAVPLFCLLIVASARADDLSYTGLDAATVRVFSLTGVGLERVRSAAGKNYVLGAPKMGHGTGLLISRDGVILTARHVVQDARLLAVQFPGEDHAVPARVVYADADHDHAFLLVSGNHAGFVPIPERKPKLSVRQTVYVIGYPLDATRAHPQSQQGIVSGVLKDGSLQLGIALNPGNSGGPVVDASEHLVGIAVARADPKAGAQGIGVAIPLEPILAGYAKMRAGGELRAAQRDLSQNQRQLAADAALLGGLMTEDDADSAWEALDGKKNASKSSRSIDALVEAALKADNPPSPEVLSLAAAQAWNSAAVAMDRSESSSDYVKRARTLALRAQNADTTVGTRSPFVAFAADDHDPTDTAGSPARIAASEERTSDEGGSNDSAMQTLLSSLETRKDVPVIRAGPTLGIITPFQLVGVGVLAKFMLADLVNVSARYQYGWHAEHHAHTSGSHFFEVLGGVALGKWHSQTTAQLIVDVEHAPWATIYHYVPGEVPSVHVLVAEGGVTSGLVNLQKTDPALVSTDFVHQSFFLQAGVRYIYFYHANSQYLARAARSNFEASAHLMAPPLGLPSGSKNADGRSIGSTPGFNVDVAWDSVLSLGQTEIGGGYFPAGDWIYFHLGWSYLFY